MSVSTKSFLKSLLAGLARLLFVIAGLSFWVGGRAISEFAKVDRVLAEMLDLGLAGVCGTLGMVLKTAGEADENEGTPSTSEETDLRK